MKHCVLLLFVGLIALVASDPAMAAKNTSVDQVLEDAMVHDGEELRMAVFVSSRTGKLAAFASDADTGDPSKGILIDTKGMSYSDRKKYEDHVCLVQGTFKADERRYGGSLTNLTRIEIWD